MSIKVGDKIPEAKLTRMTPDGPAPITTSDIFKGKKVGDAWPTCSAKHLPGFVNKAGEITAKGVDTIACVSVNDVFVMNAWGKDQQADGKVMMLADGNGEFTKAMGLELDGKGFGMGTRSQRYSLIAEDGVVTKLNIEKPGAFEVSSAETALSQL